MKKLIKMSVLFVLALTASCNIKAQMIPCIPPLDPPCTPACMQIDIVNLLPCDLDFYWGYSSCGGVTGAKKILAYNAGCTPINPSPFPPCTMYGQCAKCGDQGTCECPDKLWLLDQSGTNVMPWGDIATMLLNGNVQMDMPIAGAGGAICSGCPLTATFIRITITITGPNSAHIKFECF